MSFDFGQADESDARAVLGQIGLDLPFAAVEGNHGVIRRAARKDVERRILEDAVPIPLDHRSVLGERHLPFAAQVLGVLGLGGGLAVAGGGVDGGVRTVAGLVHDSLSTFCYADLVRINDVLIGNRRSCFMQIRTSGFLGYNTNK